MCDCSAIKPVYLDAILKRPLHDRRSERLKSQPLESALERRRKLSDEVFADFIARLWVASGPGCGCRGPFVLPTAVPVGCGINSDPA